MRYVLFLILFTASGFAGLIYESIWSHYLKLFLGHAAYAQTLVLAIFMGGMALGAWIASHFSSRWQRLLLGYAAIEAVIGVLALIFHDAFVGFIDISYHSIIPALGPSAAVEIYKWIGASALIITQSVLLGMTFPLMTAGLVRRYPDRPGATLAMLYFVNSLGAAVGVLASGFLLIDAIGLPGTIRVAGTINIIVAVIVTVIAGRWRDKFEPHIVQQTENRQGARLLLLIALGTGAASFIYEVVWLRMLAWY
jgi:spermidine synthase